MPDCNELIDLTSLPKNTPLTNARLSRSDEASKHPNGTWNGNYYLHGQGEAESCGANTHARTSTEDLSPTWYATWPAVRRPARIANRIHVLTSINGKNK